MSALPPPPPDPGGSWSDVWGPTPTPAPAAGPASDLAARPAWRQGRPGWAILHLVIAGGLSFVGLFVIGVAIAIAGRTQTQIDLADETQLGLAWVVLYFSCLIGWYGFAYMRGDLRRRWIALGGIAGGGWLVAFAMALAATD